MDDKEELVKNITRQLMRIIKKHNRIDIIPVQLIEGVEVTPTESHTIRAIGENNSINITELAGVFGVTKSAASQIVNKLAKRGFVNKRLSEKSSKELKLELTLLGQRAFEAHQKRNNQHMADISNRLGGFSISQIAIASVFLDVVEDIIDTRLKKQ